MANSLKLCYIIHILIFHLISTSEEVQHVKKVVLSIIFLTTDFKNFHWPKLHIISWSSKPVHPTHSVLSHPDSKHTLHFFKFRIGPCHNCNSEFIDKSSLHQHQRAINEGKRYSWIACDLQATSKGGLTQHLLSLHLGKKYPCHMFSYQSTWRGNLKTTP